MFLSCDLKVLLLVLLDVGEGAVLLLLRQGLEVRGQVRELLLLLALLELLYALLGAVGGHVLVACRNPLDLIQVLSVLVLRDHHRCV